MKAKKSGFIVCLVLAVIFAVVGVVLMLLPEPYTPVVVGEEVKASYSSGHIFFNGTLKNGSDSDVKLTYLEIEVKTSDGTEVGYINENEVLAPGDEYDLDGLYITSWHSAIYVAKISVIANGVNYTVYSSSGRYFTWTVLAFMVAVILGIVGICGAIGYLNMNKRYRIAAEELSALGGNPVLALGYYGRKGEAGKAAAKTAASAVGGLVSAMLFGFGSYKVYGANNAKEFVVTDEGIYIGSVSKKKFNLGNMHFISKFEMPDSEISVDKNKVTMTNIYTGDSFVFDLSTNSSVTAEDLKARLESLLSARKAAQDAASAQEPAASAEAEGEDPFGI